MDFLALTSSSPLLGYALFTPNGILLGLPLSGSPPVRGLALKLAPLPVASVGAAPAGAAEAVPSLAAICNNTQKQ